MDKSIDYQNYQNQKDQKKRELIEWERNFQTNGEISDKELLTKDEVSDKKRELLLQLWSEQRLMSANINSRQQRRDMNRKNLLENICEVERHSKELLESLHNWEERHKTQIEGLEREEQQILELMLKYDRSADLKKSAVIIAMQEMLNRESVRRALTDELKESNQLELRNQIDQTEQLQMKAFEALQRTRDYRNQTISSQILLIENELTELTLIEMQKKDERLESIINDIRTQRSRLAQLLAKLLAQKREREAQLREQLAQMESRRRQVNDSDYWFVQYQNLLERQPIEAQIRQFGIDDRVSKVLIEVHKQYERISNYLSLFADLSFDKLNAMSDKALLALGIDDYELCKLVRDVTDQQCSPTARTSVDIESDIPSAPIEQQLQSPSTSMEASASAPEPMTPSSESVEATVLELGVQFAEVRLWRQTECVICFDQNCDVVFLPCGHICTCQSCSHLIQLCPLCRVFIDIKQRLNVT